MKIIKYQSGEAGEKGLHFQEMIFSNINLIVGNSAAGKSRLLNTIFNGACLVTQKIFSVGSWDTTVEHLGHVYNWVIKTGVAVEENKPRVIHEKVSLVDKHGKEEMIIQRDGEQFLFKGSELPKIGSGESGIHLLKDEESIKPLYLGLQSIMRRNFSGVDLDQSTMLEIISSSLLKPVNLQQLFSSALSLNGKLYMLSKHFRDIYDLIIKEFINTFPFISRVEIKKAEDLGIQLPGFAPVLTIKEKDIDKWIPLHELSSGMKKVLLILTDIFAMPKDGCVYLIDEYENSLGMNAINFFPSILFEADAEIQFVITSHHPYIISNLPVKNWIVLHRKGDEVRVRQGADLEQRFGKSRQESFFQLINDPFYLEGIE